MQGVNKPSKKETEKTNKNKLLSLGKYRIRTELFIFHFIRLKKYATFKQTFAAQIYKQLSIWRISL